MTDVHGPSSALVKNKYLSVTRSTHSLLFEDKEFYGFEPFDEVIGELIDMNDADISFDEIADYIEKNC